VSFVQRPSSVTVGENVFFDERATVHIADGLIPSVVGHEVTVGKYALVHACTLEDGVVIGDAAVVMDGAVVGAYAVIAAGSLVPPRKTLPGGFLYAGNPALPVRDIARAEALAWAATKRRNAAGEPVRGAGLPETALTEVLQEEARKIEQPKLPQEDKSFSKYPAKKSDRGTYPEGMTEKAVKELYINQGKTISEVAKHFNVPYGKANSFITGHKLFRNPKQPAETERP
jgi:carbonic anhydrase/acetyltransferase-like protein (isoleucine patch superfamily)